MFVFLFPFMTGFERPQYVCIIASRFVLSRVQVFDTQATLCRRLHCLIKWSCFIFLIPHWKVIGPVHDTCRVFVCTFSLNWKIDFSALFSLLICGVHRIPDGAEVELISLLLIDPGKWTTNSRLFIRTPILSCILDINVVCVISQQNVSCYSIMTELKASDLK